MILVLISLIFLFFFSSGITFLQIVLAPQLYYHFTYLARLQFYFPKIRLLYGLPLWKQFLQHVALYPVIVLYNFLQMIKILIL